MTRNEFHQLCRSNLLILDGATGTELIKRGMPSGVSPEAWICEHPEAICAIHDAYIAAGGNSSRINTGTRCPENSVFILFFRVLYFSGIFLS